MTVYTDCVGVLYGQRELLMLLLEQSLAVMQYILDSGLLGEP